MRRVAFSPFAVVAEFRRCYPGVDWRELSTSEALGLWRHRKSVGHEVAEIIGRMFGG